MDKQKHPIDELFSQKLDQHEEKPSKLAWERLDAELGHSKKSNRGGWLRIAAILIGVLALTYILLQTAGVNQQANNPNMLSAVDSTEVQPQEDTSVPAAQNAQKVEEAPISKPERSIPPTDLPTEPKEAAPTQERNEEPKATPKTKEKPSAPSSQPARVPLLAEAIQPPKETERSPIDPAEQPQLEVPQLEEKALIADNKPDIDEAPVAYTVSIRSSGISEKPKKEKFVEELGEKINTLGGLIGKVDEGYAELQDAKNNLFASLITKKETK